MRGKRAGGGPADGGGGNIGLRGTDSAISMIYFVFSGLPLAISIIAIALSMFIIQIKEWRKNNYY